MAIRAPDGDEKFEKGLMFRNMIFIQTIERNGDEWITGPIFVNFLI